MSEHQDDRGWWLLNAPTLPWRLWPLILRLSFNAQRRAAKPVRRRRSGQARARAEYRILYRRPRHDAVCLLRYPASLHSWAPLITFAAALRFLSERLVAIVREAGGACEAFRDASEILLEGERVCGVRQHARDARDFTGGYCADRVRECCAERARHYAA